jgi:hypothetical protein
MVHQGVVLMLFSYLQIQMLLFRPILSLLLNPEVRSYALSNPGLRHWLPQAIALPCAKNCILAALEAIELIYSRQNKSLQTTPPVETLPAWWYKVFCEFRTVKNIMFQLICSRISCLYRRYCINTRPNLSSYPR